eukprot:scaffold15510_cov865-Ochromonas_danica.AAC.1
MGYMDDCTISVPSRLVSLVVAPQLAGIFSQAGLILNKTKCRMVGPQTANLIEEPLLFAAKPEGDIILGNPTGTIGFRQTECL